MSGGPYRILVLDDEPDLRRSLVEVFMERALDKLDQLNELLRRHDGAARWPRGTTPPELAPPPRPDGDD